MTAIEIWLIACIFFISVAMMEYGLILLLKTTKNADLILDKSQKTIFSNNAWKIRDEFTTNSNHMRDEINNTSKQDVYKLLKTIDKACLGMSALGFLIFNIVYWAIYL